MGEASISALKISRAFLISGSALKASISSGVSPGEGSSVFTVAGCAAEVFDDVEEVDEGEEDLAIGGGVGSGSGIGGGSSPVNREAKEIFSPRSAVSCSSIFFTA